jgi:acetyltransferase-like isoleucine patch superfamily enzyme
MRKAYGIFVQLIGMLLPGQAKRLLLSSALGWKIGTGTKIGFSLLFCGKIRLGENVRIGHFNLFRNLKVLEIGDNTGILNFNHFMARIKGGWPCTLSIGSKCLVTSHHFFDCGGIVRIGDLCCVGGRDTQFWTHALALRPDGARQIDWRELTIADRCYIGARSTLVYCRIPSDSVVGAGAVVTKDFSKEEGGVLLAGNPAEVKKHFEGPLVVKEAN